MNAIYTTESPIWLRNIPAVETLRKVWIEQFYSPNSDGLVQWRTTKDMPSSAHSIHSPYDLEARYSNKRSMDWVGYKAHLTEICDDDSPRIITHVHTTHGAVPDDQVVETIHQALEQKELLPDEHFLDGGYLSAEHLVNSKAHYGIDILVLLGKTIVGKRKREKDLLAAASRLIGSRSLQFALKDIPVPNGNQIRIFMARM
jgi:hypothetical protein